MSMVGKRLASGSTKMQGACEAHWGSSGAFGSSLTWNAQVGGKIRKDKELGFGCVSSRKQSVVLRIFKPREDLDSS